MADGEAVYTCTLVPEGGGSDSRELRMSVAEAYTDWIDSSATPALPVAAAVATAIGEDLRSEAPASAKLVRGAEEASELIAGWWAYRPARISAPPTPGGEPGPAQAALYSRGVDSSATVLRSLRGEIPERITHLLSVYGAEWMFSPATHEAVWRDTELAAAEHGLELVRLRTNARDVLKGRIGWTRAFGAAYSGVALLVGPLVRSVLFGATQHPDHAEPRGSRFDLDPLWSTERTVIRQDAAELGRLERASVVASDETSARFLKVCFAVDSPGNCGRCEKCLRTMTMLAASGDLDRVPAFDVPLDAKVIRSVRIPRSRLANVAELVVRLPDGMGEVGEAWEARLADLRAEERRERRLSPLREAWRRTRRGALRAGRRLRS